MLNKLRKGFTLVELLIVIGLLGAIALIVIAAINPIEQANRARDARFKADGGQIVSAIERYFAAHSSFPWEDCGTNCGTWNTADDAFNFVSVGLQPVGLCGTDCSTPGLLITSDEMKNEFLSRDFISNVTNHTDIATDIDGKLFVGKGQGSSSSIYACFIPKSKSNREKAIAGNSVRKLSFTNGIIDASSTCDTGGAAAPGWDAVDGSCVVCIPE